MPKALTKQDQEYPRINRNDLEIFSNELYGFWYIGRCIPSVCTMEDVEIGIENFMSELGDLLESLHLDIDLSGVTMQALNCHTQEDQGRLALYFPHDAHDLHYLVDLEAGDYVYILVLVCFAILVLIGTASDVLLNIFKLDFQSEKFLQVLLL